MLTKTIQLNYASCTIPDTSDLTASDFNVIAHSILKNTDEDKIKKFGTFKSDVNFAHDESSQVVKGREMRGGIDMKLMCISNFDEKKKGLSKLKNSINRNKQLLQCEKDAQYEWLENTTSYFISLLNERMTQRKRPMYYTSILKHKISRRVMPNAAFLIIENEDESLHLFARIGQTEYDFQFSVKEVAVKSGKQLRCEHSVYDASTIGEDDDFSFDELEFSNKRESTKNKQDSIVSNLEIEFERKPETESDIDEALIAVLKSVDDEYARECRA
ncbi:hypothetical protein P7M57_20000 [Vibrio parahaemolyticus]|nr:hypothetical protein [Vibrio parahaemolyticus]